MLRICCFVLVLSGLVATGGCLAVADGGAPEQSRAEIARIQRSIVPVVRSVPGADRALLWKATSGYMGRMFSPQEIALNDEGKQVIETHTLERVENGLAHRTVITVGVDKDPALAGASRIGVKAQRIEARSDFGAAQDLLPVPTKWVLTGNNEIVAGLIADAIMQRYLLLCAGRDPDAETPPPHRNSALPSEDKAPAQPRDNRTLPAGG